MRPRASSSRHRWLQRRQQQTRRRGLPVLASKIHNTSKTSAQGSERYSLLVVAGVLSCDDIHCAGSFPENKNTIKRSRRASVLSALHSSCGCSPGTHVGFSHQPFVSACPPRTNDLRPSPVCCFLLMCVCACEAFPYGSGKQEVGVDKELVLLFPPLSLSGFRVHKSN